MIAVSHKETVRLDWGPYFDDTVHEVDVLIAREPLYVWEHVARVADQLSYNLELDRHRRYKWALAPVDRFGNRHDELKWRTGEVRPVGDLTVPDPPQDLAVVQDDDYLEARWFPPDDRGRVHHYELRRGSAWAKGQLVGKTTECEFRFRWWASGAQTYRLVAVNHSGRRSTEITFAITVSALPNYVNGTSTDIHTGGYTGTKTDCEVDSGNLRYKRWGVPANTATETADTVTHLSGGPAYGLYEHAQVDLGSTRTVRIEIDMTVDFDGDAADQNADEWILPPRCKELIRGVEVDDLDNVNRFSPGDMIAAGDETAIRIEPWIKLDSGSWQPWAPGLYTCRYHTIRIRLYSWNRYQRVKTTKLTILERQKNLKEEGTEAVAGTPGPTTISFTSPFIAAPSLVASSDTAKFSVSVISITASQATCRVYDDGGTEVFTGNIIWIAAGA